MIRRDCFAFKDEKCCVLLDLFCAAGKCSFYKTQEEYDEGLRKYPPIRLPKHCSSTGGRKKR